MMRLRGNTLAGCVAVLVVLGCGAAVQATFHLWQVSEIYSNASGSTQFIELNSTSIGQQFFAGPPAAQLISDNGGVPNVYTFTANSPSPTTAGKKLLIATPGFDSLPGGVTPDFVIPTQFLFTGGGTLTLTDTENGGFQFAFAFDYTGLPTDGVNALLANHTTAVNSPTNFAGEIGSVPEPASLLLMLAGGALLAKRTRRRAP